MEGRDHRWWPHWRGAIADGGEQSKVEASNCWWRRVIKKSITSGGELSQVEGSDRLWRGASAGVVSGGGWRRAIAVEGSNCWWRGVVSGGGELSQMEALDGSDR